MTRADRTFLQKLELQRRGTGSDCVQLMAEVLTGPMLEVVENLEMEPFRLRVAATAGSGESLLAARFFEHHVATERRPEARLDGC